MKMEKVMINIEYAKTKSKLWAEYDYVYILDDEIIVDPICCSTVNSNFNSYLDLKKAINLRFTPYTGIVVRNQENKYYQEECGLGCDGMLEDMLCELKEYDGIEAFGFCAGELVGHLTFNKETKDITLTSNLANTWWR